MEAEKGADNVTADGAPAAPPPEEPPKIEEIVTPEVLEQIINGYNPDLSLVSWKAEAGTSVGDNYMSIMYSVELELEDKKRNGVPETTIIMLKTLPRNAFRAEMINQLKAFNVECVMYKDVLRVFVEMQEERGILKEDLFHAWPKCYATHLDGKTDFLALENLKVSGYKMGSRVHGLDFNHCALVVRSLAKYHAISYALYGGSREKILETFELVPSMFETDCKMSEMQGQFFTQAFKGMATNLSEVGESLAASRVEKMAEANWVEYLGDMTSKNIEHAVISHGDFWVNNMMFKYSEKDTEAKCPVDVKLIDFQRCQATSRLIDVYHFLMSSSSIEVMNEREQDLLMIYYAEFTSFAERLGVDTRGRGLNWENFMKEADQYRIYGVCITTLFAPMLTADSKDIPDMENFSKEDYEDMGDSAKKFLDGVTNKFALRKAKSMVLDHLPNCSNAKQYL